MINTKAQIILYFDKKLFEINKRDINNFIEVKKVE